jgi:hypothetical protein
MRTHFNFIKMSLHLITYSIFSTYSCLAVDYEYEARHFKLAQNTQRIEIQAQDASGNWRTYNVMFQNNSQLILMEMKSLKNQFPESRVRAIDQDGRLIDLY